MPSITAVVAAILFYAGLLDMTLGDASTNVTCCPGQNGTCYPSGPAYSHLPEPRCPDGTWPTFHLYTRHQNDTPVTPESIPPSFNPDVRTIFIVHGFKSSEDTTWIPNMKDELLVKGDYNVIVVDWEKGASGDWSTEFYTKAASTTRVVGSILARLTGHLVTSGGADRRQMWCVGHSLGAHACGEAGAAFRVGRVTGLDPAGPSFDVHPNIGIRQDSAEFVDVIHTDQYRIFCCGDMRPRGHVDFYPNGGREQPDCRKKIANLKSENLDWENLEVELVEEQRPHGSSSRCSHKIVTVYFTNSISRCRYHTNIECFNVTDIDLDWRKGCVRVGNDTLQEMGFNAEDSKYRTEGLFYVNTTEGCEGAPVAGRAVPHHQTPASILSLLLVNLCITL